MSSQALETQRGGNLSVKEILNQPAYKNRMSEILGQRAPQFMASIITAANQPNFKDVQPASIVSAAMVAATLDLPIDRNLGFAWVVPYKGVAQFQMGWKGYVQLAQRTGQYRRMNARAINKEALKGYDEVGEAVIDWGLVDETKPAAAYVFAFQLVNGFIKTECWTVEKMRAHAEKYSQSHRAHAGQKPRGDSCRWCADFDAMALKTITSNTLRKWGILSIEMQTALRHDQAAQADVDAEVRYVDNERAPLQAAPRTALPASDEIEGERLGKIAAIRVEFQKQDWDEDEQATYLKQEGYRFTKIDEATLDEAIAIYDDLTGAARR